MLNCVLNAKWIFWALVRILRVLDMKMKEKSFFINWAFYTEMFINYFSGGF